MSRIMLITGGQRSGKSAYAESLALTLSDAPVYMATARVWDDEFRRRIALHQQRRGPQWTNIEEEKFLSRHDLAGRTVLVDCLTLWSTNFFFDHDENDPERVRHVLDALKEELNQLLQQDATFIFVTNEIGLGGVSGNTVQRQFTDLLGWLNQYVASQAHEVTLMVSGIPIKLKALPPAIP